MSAYQSRNSVQQTTFLKILLQFDPSFFWRRGPIPVSTSCRHTSSHSVFSVMKREYGHPQYWFVLLTWRRDYPTKASWNLRETQKWFAESVVCVYATKSACRQRHKPQGYWSPRHYSTFIKQGVPN